LVNSSTKRLLGENRMEQLNRGQNQDTNVEMKNHGTGQNRPANLRYHDMQAAPVKIPKNIGFAGLVRNKSIPSGIPPKIPKIVKPTEVYHEKIKLESFKSDFVVFKNYLLDAKSLSKVEFKDCSRLLTVKEFSNKLSAYNEKSKYP
jgi:hypothetical protein